MTRLAVLGSPIAHSRSPQLHLAAYRALGLDWQYERIEIAEGRLFSFLDGLSEEWRGFSVTMPLKHEAWSLGDVIDETSGLTEASNTIFLNPVTEFRHVYNTDVTGIERAFANAGITALESVEVLGAGATAASALVAAARLGATSALLRVREPQRAKAAVDVAERLGLDVTVRAIDLSDRSLIVPSAIISTLPGGAAHGLDFAEPIRRGSVLFEVAYDPWPSPLAASWLAVGGTVVDGLDMLVEQAVEQVRIFAGLESVPPHVVAAMRAAVSRVGG